MTPPQSRIMQLSRDRSLPSMRPSATPTPELMRALWEDRLELVEAALAGDPFAAAAPFSENRFDPPLCSAIRLACSADVVRALIKCGAHVDAPDVTGRDPLTLLCAKRQVDEVSAASRSAQRFVRNPFQPMRPIERSHALQLATVLLSAGADPEAPTRNCSALDLLDAAGHERLARLLRGYRAVQGCIALRRGWALGGCPLGRLPRDVLGKICACLMPQHVRHLAKLSALVGAH